MGTDLRSMKDVDFERLDNAISTIKELMPEVLKTIKEARCIVKYEDLPNGNILSQDLFNFLIEQKASVRLLSIVKENLYKGGYRTDYNLHQVWDGFCPIYEFLTEFKKYDVIKFRNLGAITLKQLDEIFKRNGIDWENFYKG